MIHTRGARPEESGLVRDILLHAFRTDDEARLWDHIMAHEPNFKPEYAQVALADGQPVACTVLVPRKLSTPRGFVDGAIVTLVGCKPEFQRKGYGGASVLAVLRYMAQNGMALGVLYGHPTYYPRFGFAPVIPRIRQVAPVSAIESAPHKGLVPATDADIDLMASLYHSQIACYPCTTIRSTAPWVWTPRNPQNFSVFVTGDRSGYVITGPAAEGALVVWEAACVAGAEASLLSAVAEEATKRGHERIWLRLAPPHALAQKLLSVGGTLVADPATSGMAAVTNWSGVLPHGYAVSGDAQDTLLYAGKPVITANRHILTQLACGYLGVDDIAAQPGIDVSEVADLEHLRASFPKSYPKLYEAPFWV